MRWTRAGDNVARCKPPMQVPRELVGANWWAVPTLQGFHFDTRPCPIAAGEFDREGFAVDAYVHGRRRVRGVRQEDFSFAQQHRARPVDFDRSPAGELHPPGLPERYAQRLQPLVIDRLLLGRVRDDADLRLRRALRGLRRGRGWVEIGRA